MDLRATLSLLPLLLVGLCCADEAADYGTGDDADISDIILRMNNGSRDFLMEGDVLIPKTRNAMKCQSKKYSCLWKKSANGLVEIPFLISKQYDNGERSTITKAMKGFEQTTCIRFVPRKRERAYVSIEPKSGCFSLMGRVGDKQVVSLQQFGCIDNGIIQHELLHALGFHHEHSRSDRDKYIKIHWDNFQPFYKNNFDKKDDDHLDTKYDYSSVMHYGRTAFGTNRKETMTPIPDASVSIGQRVGMSKIDILRVKRLYKC